MEWWMLVIVGGSLIFFSIGIVELYRLKKLGVW